VVWDLSTSPYIDIAGARMLAELAHEFAARGVALRLAEAHAVVRRLVHEESGLDAGATGVRVAVDEVIEGHERGVTKDRPAAPA